MFDRLKCWARCAGGELPREFPLIVAAPLWLVRLFVVIMARNLPTKRNREFKRIARSFVEKWARERENERLTEGG